MAPVQWGQRQFLEAPPVVELDGEVDPQHAAVRLIRKPNPFYTGNHLLMASLMSLWVYGNTYWIVVRDGRTGEPVQLWFVPPWLIEPYSDDEREFVQFYRYTPMGREFEIDVRDVVHVRYGLDPSNIRKGLSPLSTVYREVFTDEEAANFAASVLVNQGMPGVVIMPDTDRSIPQSDVDDVKGYFKERMRGDNRGEPFVMGMRAKVEQFGWEPSKIDLRALREIPEERVAALLGIPAAVVGFGSGLAQTKVGATMEEMRRLAYENAIIPAQTMFTEEWDQKLLFEFETNEDATLTFDRSDVRVLQEDEGKKIERLSTAVKDGWLPVSVAQELAGYPVDETQAVYLRRGMTVTSPASVETASATRRAVKNATPRMKRQPSERGMDYYDRQESARDELSGEWGEELVERFNELGEAVREAFEGRVAEIGLMAGGNGHREKVSENPAMETAGAEAVDDAFKSRSNQQILNKGEWYTRISRRAIRDYNEAYAAGLDMSDELETRLISAARTRANMPDLIAQSKGAVTRAIREGKRNGESVFQIAGRIRDTVGAGPWKSAETRAEVIARTETRFAQNLATVEIGKAEGAAYYEVIDAQLGPTDAYCESIDGEIVTAADAEYLSWSEHPNGTRAFAPYFDDDAEPATIRPETEDRERDAVTNRG
jgi:HK97 family phage portal protein